MIINKLFLLSKYFNAGVSFIIILMISKILDIESFGEFSFFKLMTQYLLFSELGLLQYIFRQYSAKEDISNENINQIFSYLLISFFTVFSIFYFTGESFINFFSQSIYYIFIAIAVFFSLVSKFVIDQLRIQEKINTIIFLETTSNLILFFTVAVFTYLSITNLKYYLMILSVYLIPFFCYMLFNNYLRSFISNYRINITFNKNILKESLMLFIYGLGSLVFFSLDRLYIKFYFGLEMLGLYSFAFSIVMGFYIIIQNIFWLNTPNFIQQIKYSEYFKIKEKFKKYQIKLIKLYIGIFIISTIIYLLLINTYYIKFNNTFYYFILIHLYNFLQIFYIFEKNYFITKKLYSGLNKLLFKSILLYILLNSLNIFFFKNIYFLLIGSIFIHFVYVVMQKKFLERIQKKKINVNN